MTIHSDGPFGGLTWSSTQVVGAVGAVDFSELDGAGLEVPTPFGSRRERVACGSGGRPRSGNLLLRALRSSKVTFLMTVAKPKFAIGQLVHHRLFDYRGVVVDIDATFSLSEAWYDEVAKSRPPKDAPWYRVLVGGAMHETYVAERNLEEDRVGSPIEHPLVEHFFDSFEDGHYVRNRELN